MQLESPKVPGTEHFVARETWATDLFAFSTSSSFYLLYLHDAIQMNISVYTEIDYCACLWNHARYPHMSRSNIQICNLAKTPHEDLHWLTFKRFDIHPHSLCVSQPPFYWSVISALFSAIEQDGDVLLRLLKVSMQGAKVIIILACSDYNNI